MALSSPWDLWAGHVALSSSSMGQIYSRAMSKNLRTLMHKHIKLLQGDERLKLSCIYGNPRASLYEFDNQVRPSSVRSARADRTLGDPRPWRLRFGRRLLHFAVRGQRGQPALRTASRS